MPGTFTLSIEETHGRSRVHGFHLGTIESVARACAVDIYNARIVAGLPVVTVALIRDSAIVDVYGNGSWGDDDQAKLFACEHESETPADGFGAFCKHCGETLA